MIRRSTRRRGASTLPRLWGTSAAASSSSKSAAELNSTLRLAGQAFRPKLMARRLADARSADEQHVRDVVQERQVGELAHTHRGETGWKVKSNSSSVRIEVELFQRAHNREPRTC